jgi:ABC-type transporter Mla subunit MlaD
MSEKASQFRIGLFVIVGVAIVFGALFLFGVRSAFQPTYRFETYTMGDVEGLSVGSAVKLRGVEVGKVTEIGFSWNLYHVVLPPCVVVRCEVHQKITPEQFRADLATAVQDVVNKGLRAVIQTEGITGTSVVALQTLDPARYPPLAVPWKPKYLYIPSAPSQLGRLLASVDKTLSNLEKLDTGELSRNLNRVLVTANAALLKLEDLDTKGISQNTNKALIEAGDAIGEIKALAADARTDLKGMRLDALGPDADRLLKNLDAKLSRLIDKLDAIDIQDLNATLAGTREAARNLNDALEQLKRYPSGFLFGNPPPQQGEGKEKKP